MVNSTSKIIKACDLLQAVLGNSVDIKTPFIPRYTYGINSFHATRSEYIEAIKAAIMSMRTRFHARHSRWQAKSGFRCTIEVRLRLVWKGWI